MATSILAIGGPLNGKRIALTEEEQAQDWFTLSVPTHTLEPVEGEDGMHVEIAYMSYSKFTLDHGFGDEPKIQVLAPTEWGTNGVIRHLLERYQFTMGD